MLAKLNLGAAGPERWLEEASAGLPSWRLVANALHGLDCALNVCDIDMPTLHAEVRMGRNFCSHS